LHKGIDIDTEDNEEVYAITDGTADKGGSGVNEYVQVGDYVYVHITPEVDDGDAVKAFETVIGKIKPEASHLHFQKPLLNLA